MHATGNAASQDQFDQMGLTPDRFLARARHGLDVALQPIVNLGTGDVYGFEALMRGHANLGCASIVDVLDVAGRLRASDDLYLLLLEKALKKKSGLSAADGKKLFVNLDGRALEGDRVLHKETEKLLAKWNVAPSALCLEFSETYNYASAADAAEMIAEHRALGVRFAIDDFGRGFSELEVLYEHHPEFIKIDRFFVSGMVSDNRKRLFVTTLINLAHVLGIRVVAEGIEKQAELDQARQLDCDLAQGYLISRPRVDVDNSICDLSSQGVVTPPPRAIATSGTNAVLSRVKPLRALPDNTDMPEVFDAFRTNLDQYVFPVIDESGEPKGILIERDFKELIYSPYGRDLLTNGQFHRSVASFVRQCPIAEITSPVSSILSVFAYQPKAEGIIMTRNSRYEGFLTASSLLEVISEQRIEMARDQNPLTKLPGNATIARHSEEMMREVSERRFLCYFDFDNFKPFNDTYSFRHGDRAILIMATLLRQHFAESQFMIGHVGGDDFFVGARDIAADKLIETLQKVRRSFASSVESLYSSEDRDRGHIEALDRYGAMRRFPLLNCSIAVLEVEAGTIVENVDALLAEVTAIKHRAKEAEMGVEISLYRPTNLLDLAGTMRNQAEQKASGPFPMPYALKSTGTSG